MACATWMAPSAVLLVMRLHIFGRTLDLSSEDSCCTEPQRTFLAQRELPLTEVKLFCLLLGCFDVALAELQRAIPLPDSRFVHVTDDSDPPASCQYDMARSSLTRARRRDAQRSIRPSASFMSTLSLHVRTVGQYTSGHLRRRP